MVALNCPWSFLIINKFFWNLPPPDVTATLYSSLVVNVSSLYQDAAGKSLPHSLLTEVLFNTGKYETLITKYGIRCRETNKTKSEEFYIYCIMS